jgi:hypothetical protein
LDLKDELILDVNLSKSGQTIIRVASEDSLVFEMEVETSDTLYKSKLEGTEDREDRELELSNESG